MITQMRELIKAKTNNELSFQPNADKKDGKVDTFVHERLYEEGMKKIESRQQSANNTAQNTAHNTAHNSVERKHNSRPKANKKLTTFSRQASIKSFAQGSLPSQ